MFSKHINCPFLHSLNLADSNLCLNYMSQCLNFLKIGKNPDGYGEWAGAIDDVRLYSRSLEQAEIDALFAGLTSNDIDNDGIADSWEIKWFNNLTTANQWRDFDRDGYTDLQEYLNDFAGEKDPLGAEYIPTVKNAPEGTGYIPPSNRGEFWLMMLPGIINNN